MKVVVINKDESVIYGGKIYSEGDTFDISEPVGASLIARGYIRPSSEELSSEGEYGGSDKATEEAEVFTGYPDREVLETWEYPELKRLAAQLGVGATGKKAELIDKICSVEVEVPADAVIEDDSEEVDEAPNTDMPE